MSLVALAVGAVVGSVLTLTVSAVRKWMTKQVYDAKTHLPGA